MTTFQQLESRPSLVCNHFKSIIKLSQWTLLVIRWNYQILSAWMCRMPQLRWPRSVERMISFKRTRLPSHSLALLPSLKGTRVSWSSFAVLTSSELPFTPFVLLVKPSSAQPCALLLFDWRSFIGWWVWGIHFYWEKTKVQLLVFDATAAPVTYNMCAKLASQTVCVCTNMWRNDTREIGFMPGDHCCTHTYTHRTLQTVVPSNDEASEGGRRGSFFIDFTDVAK